MNEITIAVYTFFIMQHNLYFPERQNDPYRKN